jgi:hypothetical protein
MNERSFAGMAPLVLSLFPGVRISLTTAKCAAIESFTGELFLGALRLTSRLRALRSSSPINLIYADPAQVKGEFLIRRATPKCVGLMLMFQRNASAFALFELSQRC